MDVLLEVFTGERTWCHYVQFRNRFPQRPKVGILRGDVRRIRTPERATPCSCHNGILLVFWIFAALTLLSILSVTVSQSGPVRVAGCVLLVTLLGVGLFQRLMRAPNDGQERGKSVSPAAVVAPIDLRLISATQLVLSGGGAPFELRGRIANGSQDMQLSSVTVSLKRRDCHQGALDPQGCDTLWEDQHWVPLTVPAGESRDFATVIWAHSTVTRVRGSIRDEIVLVAATGEPRRM
jgi:hypothetical protein